MLKRKSDLKAVETSHLLVMLSRDVESSTNGFKHKDIFLQELPH